MIRPIMKDVSFLSRKSDPATAADVSVGQDLQDTLLAHRDGCVGMAANMIGVRKRIIIVDNNGFFMTMYNPVLLEKSGPYETEEGCLSLTGTRKTKRYEKIKVRFQNRDMKTMEMAFSGWTAQIIQHEMDHLEGIII